MKTNTINNTGEQLEIWKDIEGYEGIYQISTNGNIKSFKLGRVRLLNQSTNKNGYVYVYLSKNSKVKSYLSHRLVAMTFLNFIPNSRKQVIDHKNNVRNDNRLVNLQILSQRLNTSKDKKSSSVFTGVYKLKKTNKWLTTIRINGKHVHLGRFDEKNTASQMYNSAVINIQNYNGYNKEFRTFLREINNDKK